jgi:hypothetical protein
MKFGLLILATLIGMISSGVLLGSGRHSRSVSAAEKWVDANHMLIQVKGHWEDVRLIPLADHLCRSGQPLFERDRKSVV